MAERVSGKPGDGARLIVKDMGITHADFFRSLQPLLETADHAIHVDGVTIQLEPGSVEIRLGPEGRRSLGNFHLPRTRIELRFQGCAPQAIDAFIASFDTRFRRGGG